MTFEVKVSLLKNVCLYNAIIHTIKVLIQSDFRHKRYLTKLSFKHKSDLM